MKKRKGLDWYALKHRYSFRKYHFGLASVLLGAFLTSGAEVAAEEVEVTPNQSDENAQMANVSEESIGSVAEASIDKPILLTPSAGTAQEGTEGLLIENQPVINPNSPQISVEETVVEAKSSETTEAKESVEGQTASLTGKEVAANEVLESIEVLSKSSTVVSPVAARTSESEQGSLVQEHDITIEENRLKESVYKILTANRLKEMTPQEISRLGVYDFGDFQMTRELFAQLSEEQIRALTFNRNYQNLRQGQAVSGASFRSATETSTAKPGDGFSTSNRDLSREGYKPYLDPTSGRVTVAVSENVYTPVSGLGGPPAEIGRQYTFSVSKDDVDSVGYAKNLYATVTQNGGVLNTVTIDTTKLTNGQIIPLDQAADGSVLMRFFR